jgi:hypothetical protein
LEDCYGTLVPLDLNIKLPFNMGVPSVDPTYYCITMGKFLHFENVMCLYIAFVVGFVSWFITTLQHPHIDVAPHIFCYLREWANHPQKLNIMLWQKLRRNHNGCDICLEKWV